MGFVSWLMGWEEPEVTNARGLALKVVQKQFMQVHDSAIKEAGRQLHQEYLTKGEEFREEIRVEQSERGGREYEGRTCFDKEYTNSNYPHRTFFDQHISRAMYGASVSNACYSYIAPQYYVEDSDEEATGGSYAIRCYQDKLHFLKFGFLGYQEVWNPELFALYKDIMRDKMLLFYWKSNGERTQGSKEARDAYSAKYTEEKKQLFLLQQATVRFFESHNSQQDILAEMSWVMLNNDIDEQDLYPKTHHELAIKGLWDSMSPEGKVKIPGSLVQDLIAAVLEREEAIKEASESTYKDALEHIEEVLTSEGAAAANSKCDTIAHIIGELKLHPTE